MFRLLRDGARLSLLLMLLLPVSTRAQTPPAETGASIALLDVRINGWPLGLVARFVEEGGRLRIPADQFDGLGFVIGDRIVTPIAGERWVWLDAVAGLAWTIDRRAQTIAFTAPPRLLKTTALRVAPGIARIDARADWGALLGWDAFGQWSPQKDDPLFARAYSVNFDTRLFSPWFTAVSRGVVSSSDRSPARFVRLDSYVDFDDPAHSWRLRLGDSFTVEPSWSRTLRFGGVQWGRDVSLRPDLVTIPVPTLTQDAATPSTVDLFINGVQRYANAVNPGPVLLSDLPVVTGSNAIRAVVTDSAGRRTEVVLPFYSTNTLLAQGKSDFAVQAGFPRNQYSTVSNDYGAFFAAGSGSYGVTDSLTLRGYAAGARDYWTLGGGATATLGGFAVGDAALFVSDAGGKRGLGFYAAMSRVTPHFNFAASYTGAPSYTDLAGWFGATRILEQATASVGFNLDRAGQINVVYARQRTQGGSRSSVVSGTYGLDVGRRHRARLSASGYADTRSGSWGATLSLTVPLGRSVQANTEFAWHDADPAATLQLQGSGFADRLDWQASAAWERDRGTAFDAYANWDGAKVDLYARAVRFHDSTGLQSEIAQSLVLMDGGLFLAGRIDDAFGVVDTGVPGVRVALENRPVGRTGRSGRLFVSGLHAYLPNAVSIDPTDLPVDAAIADVQQSVAPRSEAGTVARFAVSRARSAIVLLVRADGTAPPAGATVRLAGSDFTAPLGFDGEIFVRGLAEGDNVLEVAWRDGQCTARFTALPIEGTLPRLGPYRCGS